MVINNGTVIHKAEPPQLKVHEKFDKDQLTKLADLLQEVTYCYALDASVETITPMITTVRELEQIISKFPSEAAA